ncbi:MAG: ImmA/IrrE family metallo-endopeptidase [Bacteroidetes bacterium]|nr:ImmA/IrrE family metallo-endopeptidase [Bacteroidota bacterium]
MIHKRIENIAIKILDKFGITKLPIPIKEIAIKMGLGVKPYDLGENVSGVLVVEKGEGYIGYNFNDPPVRRRFTIAHELGHYELHHVHSETSSLFIDNQFRIEFRNQSSSTGEQQKEIEANAFAAAILMPRHLLIKEIDNNHLDLSDDKNLHLLAKKFNVSISAMTYRLNNLDFFNN